MNRNIPLAIVICLCFVLVNSLLVAYLPASLGEWLPVMILSLVVYLLSLLVYSMLREVQKPDLGNQGDPGPDKTEIVPEQVVNYWLYSNKRGFPGLFKSPPAASNLVAYESVVSNLIEVEADAEHYYIENSENYAPWSETLAIQFYDTPVPVVKPDVFVDENQDFPIRETLTQVQCSDCLGAGHVPCGRCSGRGHVRCMHCNGSGRSSETRYNSEENRHETYYVDCSWCHGGRRRCNTCSGRGIVTCPTCAGDGTLGKFRVQSWVFKHWKNMQVFKVMENGDVVASEVADIRNEDAEIVKGLTIDQVLSPGKNTGGGEQYMKKIREAVDTLSGEMEGLPNLMFNKFSFRRMPEMRVDLKDNGRQYELVGRGFQPLVKRNTVYPAYPFSKLRIAVATAAFGLLWVMNYLLFSTGILSSIRG
ncbi:MAG: hypothetical protein ACFFD4_06025 [Candidatus Odinarchaeota archaeon]